MGLMGAGKSTVGRPLASALGIAFVDNDEQLQAETGVSAREYQHEHGRAELHEVELHVFRNALADATPSVVTAAASVVDTEAGRELLTAAPVVWLVADYTLGGERPSDQSHRPPRAADATVENMRRREWFRELADVIVSERRPPDEIVVSLTPWARALLLD